MRNISYGGEENKKYISGHYTERQKFLISYVPDFDISTQGENITNVIEMTRDAIAMTGLFYEDQNIPFPIPTPLENISYKKGDIATLVDVDFTAYRQSEEKDLTKKSQR